MSVTAIMSAFNASLASFASTNGVSVAYENVLFTPSGTSPYLRAHMIPSVTMALGLGTPAKNIHRGNFQVSAVYNINEGWGAAHDMAEKVRAHFYRGKKLMSNDLVIERSWAGPGMTTEGRYIIPVTITYYATVSNV